MMTRLNALLGGAVRELGAEVSEARAASALCSALSLGADDDDIMGALDVGDLEFVDSLADVGRRRRRAPMRRGRAGVPYRRLVAPTSGVPSRGVRLMPFGLPAILFTATSGTALQSAARPQRPFKPKRLIIFPTRVGATAIGALTITRLDIGADNQLVGAGPTPVEMYGPGTFDANLELSTAFVACDITVGAAVAPAPTTVDTVTLAIGFIGEAIA